MSELAWRIEASAAGDAVEVLLFGFIDPQDDVEIDAYITCADGRLALIEILMLETSATPHRPSHRSGISGSTITMRRF